MKQNKGTSHFGLMILFVGIVFTSLVLNSLVTSGVVYLLVRGNILSLSSHAVPHIGEVLVVTGMVSVPIAMFVAVIASKFPLKPVRNLIESMDRLASGDFKTRVNVGAIMQRYPDFVEVSQSFNKMAQQLESTEMLRSDFVNHFSHEFKTPIVSIAGFAKLLRKGNLTPQQQEEYLRVIEEESIRLSDMATNVLNLTKVENQTILTDVTRFNLSEQIRSCILLLEGKWEQKDLDLQLEFAEYEILANEELLKQVWINLLDNAIKFCPHGHTIEVQIREKANALLVTVSNTGSTIAAEHLGRIFDKFYQADASHSTHGNGVGLAIVKQIARLHGGSVRVRSKDDVTSFTVELPKS